MKEGLFIKLNWMIYRKTILNNLQLLTQKNPKEIYKKARKIYKQEMGQLPEYGENDVLKLNLAHGILIYAIYESCEQKPRVNELSKFYHNVVLTPRLARLFLASSDMTCANRIESEKKRAVRSERATHPYTWQYKISDVGDKRFTAQFSRCGIYDYFKSKGIPQLVPAMCLMDYSFCEVQKHIFLRKETLSTGGGMCDCTYISKDIATREELQAFEDDMKNEAKRGGVVL